jgi:hypothetical protein
VPFIIATHLIKPKGFRCACGNSLIGIRVANGFTKIEKDEGPRAKEHNTQIMNHYPPALNDDISRSSMRGAW